MAHKIDPTAIIDDSVILSDNVQIGPYTIIGKEVRIGPDTVIGSHCVIDDYTEIAENCHIHHHVVLGTPPQDLKYKGERTCLRVGARTVIREFADINRGTTATCETVIGSDVLIMGLVHIAHDCRIGDRAIIAGGVQMAGHVDVAHDVILGGMVPVHQFVHIGAYSIIGGGWRVSKDVPPFLTAAGEPLAYKGLNLIGLKRKGFSSDRINSIRKTYRILYQSHLNVSQALREIKANQPLDDPDIQSIVSFIEHATRGIIGATRHQTPSSKGVSHE